MQNSKTTKNLSEGRETNKNLKTETFKHTPQKLSEIKKPKNTQHFEQPLG